MKIVSLASVLGVASANLEFAAIAEGNGFTKALTLTNVGCNTINLYDYTLKMFHNGKNPGTPDTEATYTYHLEDHNKGSNKGSLPETLAKGESITICNTNCDAEALAALDGEAYDKRAAKCSPTFRAKCSEEAAFTAFTYKINYNGNDRIELLKGDELLESFNMHFPDKNGVTAIDHENSVCYKTGWWKTLDSVESSKNDWDCIHMEETGGNVEFPVSKLTAKCPMEVEQLTKTSVGFHIGMFSENCNPKECDEWTCDQWCACWENPFVPMIFDSLQYSAALSRVCPDVGPACEC